MPQAIPQIVSRLPGELDRVPVFHSNSPELVLNSGILLSTFPATAKKSAPAHLNYAVEGKFALFLHHSTDSGKTVKPQTLYLGVLLGNGSNQPITVSILGGASYATKPDAPFVVLDPVLANDDKIHYAGPGDRVALTMLTDQDDQESKRNIVMQAGEVRLFKSFDLPKGFILTPLNGRTGLFYFNADGPVHLAVVSAFAEPGLFFSERPPEAQHFSDILTEGSLVTPRDKTPTVPGAGGDLIYGRVAGVAAGASWNGTIANNDAGSFDINVGQTFSFPLSTVTGGTLGTDQIQSAPLLCRYDDTAYQSHGNFGVFYKLKLPLRNADSVPTIIELAFQSPLKNSNSSVSLKFASQSEKTVFRGTVKFEWTDSEQVSQTRLFHLVQYQGMVGPPLLELAIAPGRLQLVDFSIIYPADCTPPHVLTVSAKAN